MGVMSDLSGKPEEPLEPVADRKFLEIDVDNFDERLKAMKPRVAFQVPNTLTGEGNMSVDLSFESMEDFSPGAIAKKVDSMDKLLQARTQLSNLLTYMDGKSGAEELINKALNDPALLQALSSEAKPTASDESTEEEDLLDKEFKPKTERAKEAVENAVKTLAEQALGQTALISDDSIRSIESMIAELDRKMSEQINLILHHEDYQRLESSWRGLDYLVNNTETDEMLKIRVMNISKKELHKSLKKYKGVAWDQSPIFKQIYEQEYGQLGGEPYGSLVGDYYFDHSPPDVELLGQIAQISAASHAPFITAPAPSLLNMESWQELSNPRDLTKIFGTPEYAGWRSLRESEDSRYLAMAMPRFLSRQPYGANTNPVEEFAFEGRCRGHRSQ
ncbi:hypothetical protein GQR58_027374 [Nymphon striatum]|nr:hypothetical protein GQR58_027374 [Nymphon striatum]